MRKSKKAYHKRKSSIRGTLSIRLQDAKTRANKNDWEIDIDLDYLCGLYVKQNGKCGMSNVFMETAGQGDQSVSLDRIDSSKGYTKDNVQLTCWRINNAKNDGTATTFQEMCAAVTKKYIEDTINEKIFAKLTV